MLLDELYDYKNLLMKELCSNADVVKLLTSNEEADVPNHGLPYTQIFPYEYLPDTVDEAKTFICFDVDIVSVESRTKYTPVIYIWIVTHKSEMRLKSGGIVLDEIARAIDRQMNGSRYYGLGELELHSVKRFMPIADYLGRTLTYYTSDFNRPSGSKPRPINRKLGT